MNRFFFAFVVLLPTAAWAQLVPLGLPSNEPLAAASALTSEVTRAENAESTLLPKTGDASVVTVLRTGGTTARTLAARAADVANVLDFGADPTGVADSTAAIRAAVATKKSVWVPTGTYLVSDLIALKNGQKLYGDGRTNSILAVSSTTFNLSALGVVQLASGETGAILQDIGISFTQPQVTTRAALVAFPPAIYAQATPRFQIERVRVSAANTCLDARGNSGGAFVDTFECSAFTTGMLWGSATGSANGAKDFVHISNYHFWDFNIPVGTNLFADVFNDGNTVAASFGEIDGLDAKGFVSLIGAVNFTADASNGWYHFDNMMLDLTNGLNVAGAKWLQIGNLYTDGDSVGANIKVSGGLLQVSNYYFIGDGSGNVPLSVTGGYAAIYGGQAYVFPGTVSPFTVSGGTMELDNFYLYSTTTPWTIPMVAQTGSSGTLILKGANFDPYDNGPAISIANDSVAQTVQGNNLGLMTFTAPGPLGKYQTQSNVATLNATGTITGGGLVVSNTSAAAQLKMTGSGGTTPSKWLYVNGGLLQILNNAYSAIMTMQDNGTTNFVGTVTAPTFSGALSGNATTATTAGNVTGTVAIGNGGTGATSASAALAALGVPPISLPGNDATSFGIGTGTLGIPPGTAGSYQNVAVGDLALAGALTTAATANSALGYEGCKSLTSGASNVCLGAYSGEFITTGGGNVFLGASAGHTLATLAFSNTIVGAGAVGTSTGTPNTLTVVGANAAANATGSTSTILGYNVGPTLTSGTNNILIGTNAATDVPTGSTSNYLDVGGVLTGNLSTGALAISGSLTVPTPAAGDNSTKVATTAFVAGSQYFDVQSFTASGTWTKPAFCGYSGITCITRARLIGGGGGGGGGAMEAYGTVGSGGGSGGGGACIDWQALTSNYTGTVAVTIGAGGAAGAGATSNGPGSNGTYGVVSSFGSYKMAYGGGLGSGGQTAASSYGGGGGGTGAAGTNATSTAAGAANAGQGISAGGSGNMAPANSYGSNNVGGSGSSTSFSSGGMAAPCVGGAASGGTLLASSAVGGGWGGASVGVGSIAAGASASSGTAGAGGNAVGSGDIFPTTGGPSGGGANTGGLGGAGGGAATGAYGCGGAGGGAGTTGGGAGGAGCSGYAVITTQGYSSGL